MTKHYRDEIIRLYVQDRLTERAIARRLGIAPSTVHYWIRRSAQDHYIREETILKKRGRPRITDDALDLQIVQSSEMDPFLPATRIGRRFHVHPETVRNRLKQHGLVNRATVRKDYLSTIHLQKRFEFAETHSHWTLDQWSDVIFSDEKIFRSSGNGPPRVWRPKRGNTRFDEQYVWSERRSSGRYTIPVWACICLKDDRYTAIHRVTDRYLTGRYYADVILETFVAGTPYTYMHDLSPIHTSRVVREYVDAVGIDVMNDWPPKGADMNPIENVWGEMERRLRERVPADTNHLWEMIQTTFREIVSDPDYLNRLIGSMPNRMQSVVEKQGGWTKY